jgi:hypothetical protein
LQNYGSGIYHGLRSENVGGVPIGTTIPERVGGKYLWDLWRELAPRFDKSRQRIVACRQLQRGTLRTQLPANYKDPARRSIVSVLHQRKTLPVRATAVLARQRPVVGRVAVGQTPTAQRQAADLGRWLNEALERLVNWLRMCGKAVQESEYGLLILPAPVHYDQSPTYLTYDENGRPMAPDAKYDRDERGRRRDESRGDEWKRDENRSKKAWTDEQQSWLARRLPFRGEVISATDCVPNFATADGELEGLLVRQLYSRSWLVQHNYRWKDKAGQMQPLAWDSDGFGSGGKIYLYRYIGKDEMGLPYISYSVGGMDTSLAKDGDDDEEWTATDNLYERYGLTQLPAYYGWGSVIEDDDVAEKGVPLMDPLAQSILNLETLLSSWNVATRRQAFLGYATQVLPNMPPAYYEHTVGKVHELPDSGGIIELPSPIQPLAPQSVGMNALQLAAQFGSEIQGAAPPEAAIGAATADSGRAAIIGRGYFEDSNWMTMSGLLQAYKWAGGIVLELADTLSQGKWTGEDGEQIPPMEGIPLYVNMETLQEGTQSKPDRQRRILMLKGSWIGGIYDVECEFPREEANLAERDQLMSAADRGYATFEEVAESFGDRNPILRRAKVMFDQDMKTPEGVASLREFAATLREEEEAAVREEMVAAGEMTPGFAPTDALPPELMSQVAALSGPPRPPTEGESSLGGIVASESGAAESARQAQDPTASNGRMPMSV